MSNSFVVKKVKKKILVSECIYIVERKRDRKREVGKWKNGRDRRDKWKEKYDNRLQQYLKLCTASKYMFDIFIFG